MSKAFTKEEPQEDEELPEEADPLPKGLPNYITPAGLQRLRDELKELRGVERPKIVEVVSWAAGNGDRSENGDYIYGKKRLREIDRRIRFLLKRIESAKVVEPHRQTNRDQVFFGATVTYVDSAEQEHRVRIVGIDEARQENGEISWISPVARALLRGREGDLVKVQTPNGSDELEILEIAWES